MQSLVLPTAGWASLIYLVDPLLRHKNINFLSDVHAAGATILAAASVARMIPERWVVNFTTPYMIMDGISAVKKRKWDCVLHHIGALVEYALWRLEPPGVADHRLLSHCYNFAEISTLVLNHWERRRVSPIRYWIAMAAYFAQRGVVATWILWSRDGPFASALKDADEPKVDVASAHGAANRRTGLLDKQPRGRATITRAFVWVARLFHVGVMTWLAKLWQLRGKYGGLG